MKSFARVFGWTLLALICGFIGGIVLSEIIGIVSVLVFHHPFGIKLLPVYLAIVSAAIVLLVGLLGRRRA